MYLYTVCIRVETELGHLGHLGHVLSGLRESYLLTCKTSTDSMEEYLLKIFLNGSLVVNR